MKGRRVSVTTIDVLTFTPDQPTESSHLICLFLSHSLSITIHRSSPPSTGNAKDTKPCQKNSSIDVLDFLSVETSSSSSDERSFEDRLSAVPMATPTSSLHHRRGFDSRVSALIFPSVRFDFQLSKYRQRTAEHDAVPRSIDRQAESRTEVGL